MTTETLVVSIITSILGSVFTFRMFNWGQKLGHKIRERRRRNFFNKIKQ